jgi:hypothetical protein
MLVGSVEVPALPGGYVALVEGVSWISVDVVVSSGVLEIQGDTRRHGGCAGLAAVKLVKNVLVSDGFESGHLSSWSVAYP